jgi:hypothetical protein
MIGRIQLRILRLQVLLYKLQRNHGDPEAQARKPPRKPLKPVIAILRITAPQHCRAAFHVQSVALSWRLFIVPLYWPF